MGMRLLKKSEVAQAQAVEQKVSIDEGLKIARRVDSLREILAQEEQSLGVFRVKTVEHIHEQIKKEHEKLAPLKEEVAQLEERREKALKPLDDSWNILNEATAQLERDKATNREFSYTLEQHSKDLYDDRVRLDEREFRLNNHEQLIVESLANLTKKETEANHLMAVAQDAITVADRHKRDVEFELTHRLANIASREERATVRDTEHLAREKDFATRLSLLKDREETVARDIQRLNKK